jgi:hypothetical protein
MSEKIIKKVDEDWKSQVEREKNAASAEDTARRPAAAAAAGGAKKAPPKESSQEFAMFLSSLAMQAYGALGEETDLGPGRINLPQAKYLIDVLGMIEDKTRGNLTEEESRMIEALVYELRMKYVEKKGL